MLFPCQCIAKSELVVEIAFNDVQSFRTPQGAPRCALRSSGAIARTSARHEPTPSKAVAALVPPSL